jgi:hypothetical protein
VGPLCFGKSQTLKATTDLKSKYDQIQYKSESVARWVSDSTSKDDLAFTSERNHKYAQRGWVRGTIEVTSPYASVSTVIF